MHLLTNVVFLNFEIVLDSNAVVRNNRDPVYPLPRYLMISCKTLRQYQNQETDANTIPSCSDVPVLLGQAFLILLPALYWAPRTLRFIFYKLKAKPSTSKTITTRFLVVGTEPQGVRGTPALMRVPHRRGRWAFHQHQDPPGARLHHPHPRPPSLTPGTLFSISKICHFKNVI